MKVLCTSDWHMGIYGDPSDALKLSNRQLVDLLDQWENEYDLIVLNGDIFEVLKNVRIKFSHYDQTMRVLDDRKEVVDRFVGSKKYLWVVGNHDYTLEHILDLPLKIKVELNDGFTLIAEHGHLLRAPKEHYSVYAWHFHLMYCLSWWIDRLGMAVAGREFCFDTLIAQELAGWPPKVRNTSWQGAVKEHIVKLAMSYASLNSGSDYSSLNALFFQSAQQQCKQHKTLVIYGHSHCRQIEHLANRNMYVNPGIFCAKNQYSYVVFSTETKKIEVLGSTL
ncbi:MAG: hypothetical protein D3923_00745 [Candidatus Electrothrix sp. AR3]|nr:hypothetical protein [Candidatus Electrothrix sp. AR3]